MPTAAEFWPVMALVIAVVPIVWAGIVYLDDRREKARQRERDKKRYGF